MIIHRITIACQYYKVTSQDKVNVYLSENMTVEYISNNNQIELKFSFSPIIRTFEEYNTQKSMRSSSSQQ